MTGTLVAAAFDRFDDGWWWTVSRVAPDGKIYVFLGDREVPLSDVVERLGGDAADIVIAPGEVAAVLIEREYCWPDVATFTASAGSEAAA